MTYQGAERATTSAWLEDAVPRIERYPVCAPNSNRLVRAKPRDIQCLRRAERWPHGQLLVGWSSALELPWRPVVPAS
jgi:hypothetical protein